MNTQHQLVRPRAASPARPTITLFVACYNEAANIVGTLDAVVEAMRRLGASYEILVIDDASRDASVRLVEEYADDHPRVPLRLIVNPRNQGLARNFAAAAREGQGTYFKLVCGDNVETVDTLVAVLSQAGKSDLVLSYHDVCPGKSAFRMFLSRTYTRIVNFLNGHAVRYYNGLPVFRRTDILQFQPPTTGFGFQAELVSRLLDEGRTYREVRVDVREREGGRSTALTWRNFAAVAASLARIARRRLARLAA